MADASSLKVGAGAGAARPPQQALTPDEELRLLHAHAELRGDLDAAARLQAAFDPLEETQESPDLPERLRSRAAPGRGARARLDRARRITAVLLLAGGGLLFAASLLIGPA